MHYGVAMGLDHDAPLSGRTRTSSGLLPSSARLAIVPVVATSYVLVNLAVDLLYAFLDPRISYT